MSKRNEAVEADLSALGITPEDWAAMPAAAQKAMMALHGRTVTAEAKVAAKVKVLGVKLFAEGCDKGPIVQTGKRAGQRNACFGDVGAKTCPHGKPLKGNIGVTGLGQFPISLYSGQWKRFFAQVAETVESEADRLAAAGLGVK